MQLTLTLDSGKQFQVHDHQLFGSSANIPIQGELVFQTGMTGYIETLTDPSYAGQILVCTYPHQGNYGVPSPANPSAFESSKIWPKAVIIADYVEDKYHFEAHKSLSAWLAEHNVLGITGLDTRQLTREIRDSGRPIIATIQQDTGKSQLLIQGDCLQSPPEGVRLMDFRSSIGVYDKSAPHGTRRAPLNFICNTATMGSRAEPVKDELCQSLSKIQLQSPTKTPNTTMKATLSPPDFVPFWLASPEKKGGLELGVDGMNWEILKYIPKTANLYDYLSELYPPVHILDEYITYPWNWETIMQSMHVPEILLNKLLTVQNHPSNISLIINTKRLDNLKMANCVQRMLMAPDINLPAELFDLMFEYVIN